MRDGQPPGTQAKARVAEVLLRHVNDRFKGNLKQAAEALGYERQRLHSYTSQASFPSAEAFDNIKEKWDLDLLNLSPPNHVPTAGPPDEAPMVNHEPSLFDPPVKLKNEGVEIVLARKGPAIAVRIAISPDVKIA